MEIIEWDLEGWDTQTGWPLKSTLEELGLGNVAERLQKAGKLPGAVSETPMKNKT